MIAKKREKNQFCTLFEGKSPISSEKSSYIEGKTQILSEDHKKLADKK